MYYDTIQLANGEEVPTVCVTALNHFELVWPGATFSKARPAIVQEVLKAFMPLMEEAIREGVNRGFKEAEGRADTIISELRTVKANERAFEAYIKCSRARELKNEGLTNAEIAADLDVDESAIIYFLNKEDV